MPTIVPPLTSTAVAAWRSRRSRGTGRQRGVQSHDRPPDHATIGEPALLTTDVQPAKRLVVSHISGALPCLPCHNRPSTISIARPDEPTPGPPAGAAAISCGRGGLLRYWSTKHRRIGPPRADAGRGAG